MEWYAQEGEDGLLLGAGRQEIKECIYQRQVVILSTASEATTLQCEPAGTEMGMAREEADRRYAIKSLISLPGSWVTRVNIINVW